MPVMISPAASVLRTIKHKAIDGAFTGIGGVSAVDNTVIVQVGAFLVDVTPDAPAFDFIAPENSSFSYGLGLFPNSAQGFINTSPWNITVHGSVWSDHNFGIWLQSGLVGTSKIHIGPNGEAGTGVTDSGQFGGSGIALGSNATITNEGLIQGVTGISSGQGGTYSLTNSGTISGATAGLIFDTSLGGIKNGTVSIRNTGTITGGSVSISSGADTSDNSTIEKIKNSGILNGFVSTGRGNDVIVNSGIINGSLGQAILLGEGNDKLTNIGTINGFIDAGAGNDTIVTTGIVNGVVKHGIINGTIFLGDGTDKFIGGRFTDTVQDSNGSDTLSLGAGADIYVATGAPFEEGIDEEGDFILIKDGIDTINGGRGRDTYDASATSSPVTVNLDVIPHNEFIIGDYGDEMDPVAANTAEGYDVGWDFVDLKDRVFNFENVIGGGGFDVLMGSAAPNTLDGGAGVDYLYGYAGNDNLVGGTGDDVIEGGVGNDTISGDDGSDEIDGGPGNDTLLGGADGDEILGGTGNDAIDGGDGGDTLVGGAGNDTINGGDGDDHLVAANYGAAGVNDTCDDILNGGNGNDFLDANGYGNDILLGGDGADTIYGGNGKDILTGGNGADIFVFGDASESGLTNATRDEITDFQSDDLIDLSFVWFSFEGPDDLVYIGSNVPFSHVAGQLHS